MSDDGYRLAPPALDWSAEGGPRDRDTGDVYFSAEDGLAETRAVFLAGCALPERWSALEPDRRVFTVGELGFGSGLNALALHDLWRRTRPNGARLHMVSIEARPWRREDAARALSAFRELSSLADALLAQWPAPRKGLHRLHLADGVTLSILHGRAPEALSELDFAADAWFLDGFAPAANPAMWSEAVFAEIARLSAPGARAATFTVAGAVRRGLAAAGFKVDKRPGFGRKRERLEAVFEGAPRPVRPDPFPRSHRRSGAVCIIGGGIAAASLVHAFARRGVSPIVVAQGGWARGASGAPSGLFTPRLEVEPRPHARALLGAFDYARRLYGGLSGFEGEGALRLAADSAGEERLDRLGGALGEGFERIDAGEAAARTGVADAPGGLWMAGAGRFDPGSLVAALAADAPTIDARAARLEETPDGWRVLDAAGGLIAQAGTVILAGGADADRLIRTVAGLELERTAGRVALFEGPAPAAPIAWGGYVSGAPGGGVLLGATHVKGADPGDAIEAEAALRADLAARLPALASALGAATASWGGARAATRDRLPLAGPAPHGEYAQLWGGHARGGPAPGPQALSAQPGLHVLTAFGARGFAHAPLLAEALVSDLEDEPAALEVSGRGALHPARFAWRAAKRG